MIKRFSMEVSLLGPPLCYPKTDDEADEQDG